MSSHNKIRYKVPVIQHLFLILSLNLSGTPGRVFDMIRRRTLRTRGIKMLVRKLIIYIQFVISFTLLISLHEHINYNIKCTFKVLDEADEMLNKGFKEQIYDVYRYLPPSTQVNSRLRGLGWCAIL